MLLKYAEVPLIGKNLIPSGMNCKLDIKSLSLFARLLVRVESRLYIFLISILIMMDSILIMMERNWDAVPREIFPIFSSPSSPLVICKNGLSWLLFNIYRRINCSCLWFFKGIVGMGELVRDNHLAGFLIVRII